MAWEGTNLDELHNAAGGLITAATAIRKAKGADWREAQALERRAKEVDELRASIDKTIKIAESYRK